MRWCLTLPLPRLLFSEGVPLNNLTTLVPFVVFGVGLDVSL